MSLRVMFMPLLWVKEMERVVVVIVVERKQRSVMIAAQEIQPLTVVMKLALETLQCFIALKRNEPTPSVCNSEI